MAKKKPAAPAGKGAFYRLMRDLHGYASAFAFLALLLFAATGILLNHPNLVPGSDVDRVETTVQLTPDELARVKAAAPVADPLVFADGMSPDEMAMRAAQAEEARAGAEPGRILIEIVRPRARVVGAYVANNISGSDLFTHAEGARGVTDLTANLDTGVVKVTAVPSNIVQVMNGLHTGELTGTWWKLVIDVFAATLILVSVFGYILFFSLRFRLGTALVLTGLSLAGMVGVFIFLVG